MDDNVLIKVAEYALKLTDQTITPGEFEELNSLFSENPEAARHYNCLMLLIHHFRERGKEVVFDERTLENIRKDAFWQEMSDYEKNAAAIEIAAEKPQRELIRDVVYPSRETRKISKFSIFALFSTAAAILFFLFLRFVPSSGAIEAATLTDSLNAKWGDNGLLENGTRMITGKEGYSLTQGLVKVLFDTSAQVVIEAPAEFRILAENRMGLTYGKVYIKLQNNTTGFSVHTQNSRIIDMGTEFGVEADPRGDTRLYVLKGKTALITGQDDSMIQMEVGEGSAKSVSGSDQPVMDIPCDKTHFARDFDSANTVVWRQQPSLDLADMVRGGNGLGTGNSAVRLNPVKGLTTIYHFGYAAAEGFLPIPELAFIDGLFVPNGLTQQIVSTQGDIFKECPPTSGIFEKDVLANPERGILRSNSGPSTIQFYGQDYTDDSNTTCIVMYANLGLTFDLNAIRRSYGRGINRFTSRIGIADMGDDGPCNADFWVLVDGNVRYSLKHYKQKGILTDVSIEINDTDRFLTLATTDGGDPDNPDGGFYQRAISCDWCVFTEPILVLE